MTERRSPVEAACEQVLDAFVYAPIGLVFEGPSLFPKLVEKGRNQVSMARTVGEYAVPQLRSEAERAAKGAQQQVGQFLAALGVVPSSNGRRPAATTTPPATTAATQVPVPSAGQAEPAPLPVAPSVATLAIPDYDDLAATQVVRRLRDLSDAERDAVRHYESANRGRKTILNKIAQLSA